MRTRLFSFVIIVAAAACFFLDRSHGPAPAKPVAEASLPDHPKAAEPVAARSILQAVDARLVLSPAPATVPQPCRAFWGTMTTLDLTRLMSGKELEREERDPYPELIATVKKADAGKACNALAGTHPLSALHEAFVQTCAPEKLAFPHAEITPETMPAFAERQRQSAACFEVMRAYRLRLARELNRKTPLEAIQSTATLFAMAMGETQAPDAQLEKLDAISQRILELEPRNAVAADVLLRAKYAAWREKGRDATSERDLELAAQRLGALNPKSEALTELGLARAKETGDTALMRRLAAEASLASPGSDTGRYYLAWASYLDGDTAGARARLSELVQASPDSMRAKFTLNRLTQSADPSGPPPFVEEPSVVFPASLTPIHFAGESAAAPEDKGG